MQPGPAAIAIQVTSCGMGAKTAPVLGHLADLAGDSPGAQVTAVGGVDEDLLGRDILAALAGEGAARPAAG